MAEQRERPIEVPETSIQLPALSRTASAFVAQHPHHARVAVAAALEAAAAQFESLNLVESRVPAPLRAFIVEPATAIAAVGLIAADEAAGRLGVSRATVYNWIEAGRMIGWRLTRQGTLIPAEQILGKGELVAGIESVLQVIADPRAAWRFLNEESQHFETPQRPIDVLKTGKVEDVLAAARASGEAFT